MTLLEVSDDRAPRNAHHSHTGKRTSPTRDMVTSFALQVGKNEKPPPNCIDLPLTLAELFRGCRKEVTFHRREFMGTQYEKGHLCTYTCKVRGGLPVPATTGVSAAQGSMFATHISQRTLRTPHLTRAPRIPRPASDL